MAGQRTLMSEFVSEAKEHLSGIADDLLALEQHRDGPARDRIDRLFRAVHSVKGGAGFFGCKTIEELAHAMESVLERTREQELEIDAETIEALLGGADRITALLDDVEHSNNADVIAPLARLRGLLVQPFSTPAKNTFGEPPLADRQPGHAYLFELQISFLECSRQRGWNPVEVLRRVQELGTIVNARLEVPKGATLGGELPTEGMVYHALFSTSQPPERFKATLGLDGIQLWVIEGEAAPVPPPTLSNPPPATNQPPPPNTVRIPVDLVDRLMTLAGELVLVRNQAVRTLDPREAALRPVVQRLDAVTSELQEAVLRTRMQPVGNLFGKFPRLVRDLAKQLGKQIELEVTGTEVELDKTILESLSDPLTHLIRNCCDHGIEAPEQRVRAGKPAEGRIRLAARHLGGQIYIEVRDDGRGVDPEAVRRKALEQGTRNAAELARLGDKDLLSLILLPGFSTAAAVTDLSGRGVGMDVVKTNLDRLGGALEMDSLPGRGTAFTLRLPLTLAIIPCLIVTAGGERYAVPQKDLEELIYVDPRQSKTRIEFAFDREVVRLRGQLLPLVRLGKLLLAVAREEASSPAKQEPSFVAVVKAGSRRFGLVVDGILTTEEIVVKPMHSALRGLACFAGATIMGDGRVALILSIEGIARQARVRFEAVSAQEPPVTTEAAPAEMQTVLLFRYGLDEQFALPLAMIRRLVRIRPDRIERVGGREFVTVDSVPTQILRLDAFLKVSPCQDRSEMFLLLPRGLTRPLGVLVAEVIDTQALVLDVRPDVCPADGLLGSALIRGRLTLVPDLYRLGDRLAAQEAPPALPPARDRRRVLLVEDTQFFRQLVKGYLETAGFDVVTATNGAEGLERLEAGAFDLVVSDIEMPVMNGYEFARAVRRRRDGAALPLLALTTLSSDADRERTQESGFDGHEVKIDRAPFLAAVSALLRDKVTG
jgi:two-component system chemotaxis sensor kinase CheA